MPLPKPMRTVPSISSADPGMSKAPVSASRRVQKSVDGIKDALKDAVPRAVVEAALRAGVLNGSLTVHDGPRHSKLYAVPVSQSVPPVSRDSQRECPAAYIRWDTRTLDQENSVSRAEEVPDDGYF